MVADVAIYVSNAFHVSVLLSQLSPRQVELGSTHDDIVIGCYKPPYASCEAVSNLTEVLSNLNESEMILIVDINWDWLRACNSLNLKQLIALPESTHLSQHDLAGLNWG